MRLTLSIWTVLSLIYAAGVLAQEPETFAEAKSRAAASGKPILMEFLRSG